MKSTDQTLHCKPYNPTHIHLHQNNLLIQTAHGALNGNAVSITSSSSIDATHRLAIGKRAVMELGKPLLLQIGAHLKLVNEV